MAHQIFGTRFIGKQSAWHGIGVADADVNAIGAFETMGEYDVIKMPAAALTDGEVLQNDGAFFIVRPPTGDDPVHRFFGSGTVSEDWVNVTPAETVQIADASVRDADGAPVSVETMGALGYGERMFITYSLGDMSIAGEEIKNYLIYLPAFQPGISHKTIIAPVRVVCNNTMRLALDTATDSRNFAHVRGIEMRMAEWLGEAYDRAMNITRIAKAQLEKMAETPLTLPEVKMIAATLYTPPPAPQRNSSLAVRDWETREANYEKEIARMKERRDHLVTLWQGAGIGMDAPALAGTVYGLYQATCEAETHRRGKATARDLKLIEGDRGDVILKAYTACLQLV